jgi:predicted anti-sigma-YlaC factor YlaD
MNFEKIACKDVANHICESLGEELNSPKCLAIKEHLENCPTCREYFNSVKKTIHLYQDYNVELPDDVHKRLMDCLGLNDKNLNES